MNSVGITKLLKKVKFKALQNVPRNPGGRRRGAAKRYGKKVDKELCEFYSTKNTTPTSREAKSIIVWMVQHGLQVVSTQTKLVCSSLMSIVDMVACSAHGTVVVVEIKTGKHYRDCCDINGLKPRHTDERQAQVGARLYPENGAEALLVYALPDGTLDVSGTPKLVNELGEDSVKKMERMVTPSDVEELNRRARARLLKRKKRRSKRAPSRRHRKRRRQ